MKDIILEPRQIKLVQILLFLLIVTFLLGYRENVGIDYLAYKNAFIYEIKTSLDQSLRNSDNEWLFLIVSTCIKAIDFNYRFFFLFWSFCFVVLLSYFLSQQKPYAMSILCCFIAFGLLFWCLGFIRQGLAFVVILNSLKFFYKRKYITYYALVFIAAGFHRSAYLFLLLPFFRRFFLHLPNKKSQVIYIFLYLITYLFSSNLESAITDILEGSLFNGTAYEKYGSSVSYWKIEVTGSGYGLLARHLFDIGILMCIPLLKYAKQFIVLFLNLFLVGCLSHNVFEYNVLLSRLPICFDFMFVVVGGAIIYISIKKWRILRLKYRLSSLLMLVCMTLRFAGEIITNPYSLGL